MSDLYELETMRERREAEQEAERDAEALAGARLKWALCRCDDGTHGFADRGEWLRDLEYAMRQHATTGPEVHLIGRATWVMES